MGSGHWKTSCCFHSSCHIRGSGPHLAAQRAGGGGSQVNCEFRGSLQVLHATSSGEDRVGGGKGVLTLFFPLL